MKVGLLSVTRYRRNRHVKVLQIVFLQGGTQQLMEEKKRQEAMEDNYNLVWNQDSFTSATVSEKQSSLEHEDNDES